MATTWTSTYSAGTIDSAANQPNLVNGADVTDVSQIHAVRDAAQTLETKLGTQFNVITATSLLQTYSNYTQSMGTYTSSYIPKVTYAHYHANDLSRAIGTLSASKGTVVIASGSNVIISSNYQATSSATLRIEREGYITVNDGITLSISGAIDAGNYQIFKPLGSAVILLASGALSSIIYDTWFGVNYQYANTIGKIRSGIILTGSGVEISRGVGPELLITGSNGTANKGIILTNADGDRYRIFVDNAGAVQTEIVYSTT